MDLDLETHVGEPAGHTRRTFVRGIAAAGASTAAATAVLDATGLTHLVGESAVAATGDTPPMSEFTAIAASSADTFEVPEGFRAYTIIGYGDEFENTDGTVWTYGYNNDFLAYFPLNGSNDEGLLFVNHEYPAPFFQNGYKTVGSGLKTTKTNAETYEEIESVGNAIVHIKRDGDGRWQVVSPSKYNRRIFGGDVPGKPDTTLDITGPLAGPRGFTLRAGVAGDSSPLTAIGTSAKGTVGNCSGGITPWGTALSCEENYDSYGYALGANSGYGWGQVDPDEYNPTTGAANESRKYGWVCEHDPYDPNFTGRKHTALGRFRHENTAFRAKPGKKFVIYMGDDQNDQGVYKFVSTRKYIPESRDNNLRILTEGTLYIAKWTPEGRRRFAAEGDPDPVTATSGTGEWVEVEDWELHDTRLMLAGVPSRGGRRAVGDDDPMNWATTYSGRFNVIENGVNVWDTHFATNRPEDVEVDVDGTVYIAFTNNTTSAVKDRHGAIRKLTETNDDPEGTSFTWVDYAEGGPTGREDEGEKGFSCCDNLVFDNANNIWVVTDISSSSLKGARSENPNYVFHGNNAVFMIPRSGPNAGIGFRFANMPVEAEGTGPYFTPDERTLFVNVQHPGEDTADRPASVHGDLQTYTSWWPKGNRTANVNPSTPIPTTVAVERIPVDAPDDGETVIPPPPPAAQNPPAATPATPPQQNPPQQNGTPRRNRATAPESVSVGALAEKGALVTVQTTRAGTITLTLTARIGGKSVTLVKTTRKVGKAGSYRVRLKPGRLMRSRVRRAARDRTLTAKLSVKVPGAEKPLSDTLKIRG